jgi:pilus assembly protein Flp/PilA
MMFVSSLASKAYTKVRKFVTGKDEGASLAEYAMLLAVVTVALIAAITAFAGVIQQVFSDTGTQLSGAAGG